MNPDLFLTHSLPSHLRGDSIARILSAAIEAANPGEAVSRHLTRSGDSVSLAGGDIVLKGNIFILGIGKASEAMATRTADILGNTQAGGLVVTKHRSGLTIPDVEILEGGHPIPDDRSLSAGNKIEQLIRQLKPDDLLICLISGGGSALVTSPVEGVSLGDLRELTSLLLECGARIDEINALRRQLDRLKGGGLAQMAAPAQVAGLILSDVVGNPLEAIASGPTAPDPTSANDALAILEKYNLIRKTPKVVLKYLKYAQKPQESFSFDHVRNTIIGSNFHSAQAALRQAEAEGFNPYLLRTDLQGEAREAARDLSVQLRWAWKVGDPVPRPACIVLGGETTVTVVGDGHGGRNTELALAAVTELADFPDVMLVTLATDGEDGATDAAGAVVTGETWHRGYKYEMNSTEYLHRNDSYTYFSKLDDLLRPGPTGTNVNDLTFLFTF